MKRILVLHRGWVVVGDVSEDGENLVIANGGVIRRWGTTKGLGEIAEGGPNSGTIIDKAPDMRVHKLGVVLAMDCNAERWAGK
jgi:hypothetical protein